MKKWFIAASFIILSLMTVAPVLAGNSNNACPKDAICIDNPLGSSVSTPQALIGKVINGILGVTGSIALIVFIWGGFIWMTAAGASDKVQHGKDTLVWATIGLVVIFSAYAMVRFVFSDILGGA